MTLELRDIEQVLYGDRAAATRLVRELTPVIQARVARVLVRHRRQALGRTLRQEVEDMTQETFVSLLAKDGRALRTWDPARGLSLKNFVGLVAERQALAILRTGKRSPWKEDPTLNADLEDPSEVAPATPEALVGEKEAAEHLLDRLQEEVSPLGWHLFQLLFVEQRSIAEISEAVHMKRDAIYAWRSRLRKLADRLAGELVSEEAPESMQVSHGR